MDWTSGGFFPEQLQIYRRVIHTGSLSEFRHHWAAEAAVRPFSAMNLRSSRHWPLQILQTCACLSIIDLHDRNLSSSVHSGDLY